MKVTMADVMSINGMITDGPDGDVRSWASAEDEALFKEIISRHDVMVMGRATYEQVRPRPRAGLLRIVLTGRPDNYIGQAIAGQLEFTRETAKELLERLDGQGSRNVLIAGGSDVNRQFLSEGLVDELIVTIEPLVLMSGVGLVNAGPQRKIPGRLIEMKQLNDAGAVVLRYDLSNKITETPGSVVAAVD